MEYFISVKPSKKKKKDFMWNPLKQYKSTKICPVLLDILLTDKHNWLKITVKAKLKEQ